MGACCSCQIGPHKFEGFDAGNNNHNHNYNHNHNNEEHDKDFDEDDMIIRGDLGAHVRLRGSSKVVSMFSRQGKKGTNQDAMTVWENFTGDKDMVFCGVFDGHGPSGHNIAQYVRDLLPAKLSSSSKRGSDNGEECNSGDDSSNEEFKDPFFTSWKGRINKCFQEMDEELEANTSIESYCSGTTTVAVLKKGDDLIIANLGDSRAVLCTRDDQNQLHAEQLTVDLKPNLRSEAERIKSCRGRVMAMEEEPNVYRIWMPDEDCPGLAMARAFGDFCLKDYGLISKPQLFHRKLTMKDEFVVLATDGVWDVLTNNQVVAIVASAKKRSMAAKMLVDHAVRAWRYKYPMAKVDDCAVVCLFFKRQRPSLTKSFSEVTHLSLNQSELLGGQNPSNNTKDDGLDTVLNCNLKESPENNAARRSDQRRHHPRNRRKFEFVES